MRTQRSIEQELNMDGAGRFQQIPQFGDSLSCNSVKYVIIEDANRNKVKIYYKNNNILVKQVMKKYLKYCCYAAGSLYLTTVNGEKVDEQQKIQKYYLSEQYDRVQFYSKKVEKNETQENKKHKINQYLHEQLQAIDRESSDSGCSDTSSDEEIYKNLKKVKQSEFKIAVSFKEQQDQLQNKQPEFFNIQNKKDIVSKVKGDENEEKDSRISESAQKKNKKEEGKNRKIIIKYSAKQSAIINYDKYQDYHTKTVILHKVPNSRPTYCLKFNEQILMPDQKLKKIEQFSDFRRQKLKCKVIRCSEKLVLMLKMNQKKLQCKFKLPQKVSQKISTIKNQIENHCFQKLSQEDCSILSLYTATNFYSLIEKQLQNLRQDQQRVPCNDLETLCMNFHLNLSKLRNYFGDAHRFLQNIKFTQFYQKGDCFCWCSVVSATKNKEITEKISQKKNGTLIHITSLTGKDLSWLSCEPKQQEIVFMAYSYFVISNIKSYENFDEIWVDQIPSPMRISPKIILWVDDKVEKHQKFIYQIQNKNPQLQIFQLSSTKMLSLWLIQFWWMLELHNIKLKVISNMVRMQLGQENYFAGVNVLIMLSEKQTREIQTLIYCKDTKSALQNIQKKEVQRKYEITKNKKQLVAFCLKE